MFPPFGYEAEQGAAHTVTRRKNGVLYSIVFTDLCVFLCVGVFLREREREREREKERFK